MHAAVTIAAWTHPPASMTVTSRILGHSQMNSTVNAKDPTVVRAAIIPYITAALYAAAALRAITALNCSSAKPIAQPTPNTMIPPAQTSIICSRAIRRRHNHTYTVAINGAMTVNIASHMPGRGSPRGVSAISCTIFTALPSYCLGHALAMKRRKSFPCACLYNNLASLAWCILLLCVFG